MTKNNEKVINIPNKSEELAELVGIILGDGCITAYRDQYKNNMNFNLRITCHSIDDYIYVTKYINNLLIKLFNTKPYINKAKDKKAIRINIQSVRLIKFLNSIGLKSGNKKRNNQGIPSWIFKNKIYLKACIRGLIDTDGCVFDCKNNSTFPRIGFYSLIPQLKEDFRKSLLKMGLNPLKWYGKNTAIYRKNDVFKYAKEIGFSNPKHKEKFNRLLMLLSSSPVNLSP